MTSATGAHVRSQLKGSYDRYSIGAMILHWLIALMIIGQIVGGLAMVKVMPKSSALTFEVYQLHKSFGITILLLSLLRLLWRLGHRPPTFPSGMKKWEQSIASLTHVGFYFFMIAIPLVGWAMVSVSPYNLPTVLFKIIDWPHLPFFDAVTDKKAIEGVFKQIHFYLALGTVVLLLAHIGAALKHHFIDRDTVLARMMPGVKPRTDGARTGIGPIVWAIIGCGVLTVIGVMLFWEGDQQGAPKGSTITAETTNPRVLTKNDLVEQPGKFEEEAELSFSEAPKSEPQSEPAEQAPVPNSVPSSPPAQKSEPVVSPTTVQTPTTQDTTPAPTPAAISNWNGQWTMLKDQSNLSFTGTQSGNSFTGQFDQFTADIRLDPARLSNAYVKVTVEMQSAKTGDGQRDGALPESDWFAVTQHPKSVFESEEIRRSDNGYEAIGILTIRDISQPLILPFTLTVSGDQARAKGSVSILRTDFGVGQGEFTTGQWVGLEVKINFDVTATR